MTAKEIAALLDRPVTAEEVRDTLERPIGADERDDLLSLVRWFTTRYPSAPERLAYVRRAFARWRQATRG